MRIAVASNGLDVSTHGGRCTDYTCYTVTRGVIAQCQNFPNPCLPPRRHGKPAKQDGGGRSHSPHLRSVHTVGA